MKFGFGTIGMQWPIAELAARAYASGYEGVSLRCAPPSKERPGTGEHISLGMTAAELDQVKRTFDGVGVRIQGIRTRTGGDGFLRCDSNKIDWDAHTAEIARHAQVAERLGSLTLSIQVERADKKPDPGLKWDWDDYLNNLGRSVLAGIKGTNLTAVFHNHVWAASALQLIQMIERIGDSHLAIVFSPDHSIVMQEDPVMLAADHPATISCVHVADRKVVKEDLGEFDGRYYYVRYESCLAGEGLVPFKRLFNTLDSQGWDGYVSLKYERKLEIDPSVPTEEWRSGSVQTNRVGPTPKFGWHLPETDVVLDSFLPFMKSLGYEPKMAMSR